MHAAVLQQDEFLGLVELADLSPSATRKTFAELAQASAGPVVSEATSLEQVARLLLAHESQAVPVLRNDGSLLGIVTSRSLLAALLANNAESTGASHFPRLDSEELERLALQQAHDLRRSNRILQAEMSERLKAEAAQRRSATLLRSVVDNVPAIIARLNLDGTLAFVNQVMPGFTCEQMLGRHVTDLVVADRRDDMERMLADSIATGRAKSFESPGAGPEGALTVYSWRVAPVREGERVTGLIGIATDVTETKQAEAQVRYYAEIVESIQMGLYVYKVEPTDAGSTLRCVSANPAAERLTGVPIRDCIGRTVDEIYPDLRQTGFVDTALQVLDTNHPVEVNDFWFGDERVPHSAWSYTMFPLTDRCVGVAFQNVTERNLAEEHARDLQAELAHVSRLSTMGEMASGLAHELNQPLAAIIAYADACQELVDSERIERAQLLEVLRSVSNQAERAGKIIHRLRSLVKKSQPVRSPIQINDAVREVAALLETETRSVGAQLRLELEDQLPSTSADFVQIQQVVLNLMRNGLDALADAEPDRRELTVSTRVGDEGQVEITIRDGGRGVTRENAARLFEPFFTTKSEGLGMGLPISRTIVEAHGGRLWLTPNPDEGMTARFVLPTTDVKVQHVPGTDRLHRR
jgi:PAS domain S-box-containing protein